MGIYHALLRRLVIALYRQVSAGRYGLVLALCARDVRATMAGDGPLGGVYPSRRSYRRWFQRVTGMFALHLTVNSIEISGPPGNTEATVAWTDRVTARDGRVFTNNGRHHVLMRWGRITAIHYDWDTQVVTQACAHAAALGHPEATAALFRP